MIEHKQNIRVRYAETDQMGFVYHGNYATYFEVGRVDLMRSIGLSYKELEESGVMLPVVSLEVQFHKPATYDENLELVTSISEFPTGVKLIFNYQLFNEKKELLTTGKTVLVFVDKKTLKPIPCPEYMQKTMQPYYQI